MIMCVRACERESARARARTRSCDRARERARQSERPGGLHAAAVDDHRNHQDEVDYAGEDADGKIDIEREIERAKESTGRSGGGSG